MFAETLAGGVEHRGHRVDDELGGREVGRRLAQSERGQLEEYEEMVGEDHLDGRRSKERDLVGLVQLVVRWPRRSREPT